MIIAPTEPGKRIISLDILRGFAILGILIMNIQSFSMIEAAYMNPTAYGDFTGINKIIWLLSHIFADSKFMTIFSILFGAGIILFTERLKEKGAKSLSIHYRRTLWLLIIGMVHAYAFWYGDILVTYALCALWVVLFRNKSPKSLLIIGIIFISVSSLLYLFFQFSIPYMPEEAKESMQLGWLPSENIIQDELKAYTGGFMAQLKYRIPKTIQMETTVYFINIGWRAGGLMLVGMALYKWGVLSAKKSIRFYGWLTGISLVVGLIIVAYGLYRHFEHNFAMEYSFFKGSQFNYWGSILVSLGYIGFVMMLIKSFKRGWLAKSLQAVGQTALSNYLIQTLICIFIFYGYGFALFGKVERWQLILIVMGIWTLQLVISPLWLKKFRYGPFEWLWRSLTYWKLQPFKRKIPNQP